MKQNATQYEKLPGQNGSETTNLAFDGDTDHFAEIHDEDQNEINVVLKYHSSHLQISSHYGVEGNTVRHFSRHNNLD